MMTLPSLMKAVGGHAIGAVKDGEKTSGLQAVARVPRVSVSVRGSAVVGETRGVVVKVTISEPELIGKMGDGTVGGCLQCFLLGNTVGYTITN